ncbi:hypothetical protein SM033_00229 [Vibrio phage vB_VpaM_sm033]|nr:hypothetical protein SM033_00229 [Vibrio phage vB_VpaM_sm033]
MTQAQATLTWDDAIQAKNDFEANFKSSGATIAQHGLLSQQNGVLTEKTRADQTLVRLNQLQAQVDQYMADKKHLLVASGELTPSTLPLAYAITSFYTSSLQALTMILENFANGK